MAWAANNVGGFAGFIGQCVDICRPNPSSLRISVAGGGRNYINVHVVVFVCVDFAAGIEQDWGGHY